MTSVIFSEYLVKGSCVKNVSLWETIMTYHHKTQSKTLFRTFIQHSCWRT